MSNFEQIFILLGAVVSSTALWKFFSDRMALKAEQRREMLKNSDSSQYRMDLKERVETLTIKLEEANEKILELTEKVSALEVENKFLQKEIDILKSK